MSHDKYYDTLVSLAKRVCPDDISYVEIANQELSAPIDSE